MKSEPLVTVASVTALVTAVIVLLVAFGVSLTDGQQTAILGVVAAVVPFVVAAFARPKVTPAAPAEYTPEHRADGEAE